MIPLGPFFDRVLLSMKFSPALTFPSSFLSKHPSVPNLSASVVGSVWLYMTPVNFLFTYQAGFRFPSWFEGTLSNGHRFEFFSSYICIFFGVEVKPADVSATRDLHGLTLGFGEPWKFELVHTSRIEKAILWWAWGCPNSNSGSSAGGMWCWRNILVATFKKSIFFAIILPALFRMKPIHQGRVKP